MQNLMQLSITNLKKVLTLFLILGLLLTSTADSFGQGKLKRQGGSTGPGLDFISTSAECIGSDGLSYHLEFENEHPYLSFYNVTILVTFQSGSTSDVKSVNLGYVAPSSSKYVTIPLNANFPSGAGTIIFDVSYTNYLSFNGSNPSNEVFQTNVSFCTNVDNRLQLDNAGEGN